MNDSQLISLGMVLLVVLMGILVNNFRVGDLSGRFTDLNRNLDTTRDLLRAEMAKGLITLQSEVKGDIANLRAEVKILRSEVQADIATLRSEVKTDIANLRSDVKADIGSLRTDMNGLRTLVERNHETTQASLADIDARVSGLEQRAA